MTSKSQFNKKTDFAILSKFKIEQHTKSLTIPDALYDWYTVASPLDVTIPWTANTLHLFDPRKLENYQAGYRFNAITGEPIEDWNTAWLVFAFVDGDPIIIHMKDEDSLIYMDIHGTGVWKPLPIAKDLDSFLSFLIAWCKFINKHGGIDKFRMTIYDDDSIIYPEILDEMRKLTELAVGESYAKNLMRFLWDSPS